MLIDTSKGTLVIGSSFDRIITTYRDREGDNYEHSTIGTLNYADDWLLVNVDNEIARYYAHQVEKRLGVKLQHKTQWGAHVSAIRGEALPQNDHMWGHDHGRKILVQYTHSIYTNGSHWWLNVLCDDLTSVRSVYGLPTNKRWFHLTIGRL